MGLLLTLVFSSCLLKDIVKKRLPPPTQTRNGVVFRLYAPYAKTVNVAGDWNNWGGTAGPESRFDETIDALKDNSNGVWTITIPYERIKPGRHTYKFVVDGNSWIKDPYNFQTVNEGGFNNSLIIIKNINGGRNK